MPACAMSRCFSLCLTLFAVNAVPVSSSPIFQYLLQNSEMETQGKGSALDILNGIKKYYLPLNTNNSNCDIAVQQFLPSILKESVDSWALKMVDSWGKIPDGFFFGNIHIVGMYEECLKVRGSVIPQRSDNEISIKGKYCKIFYEHIETEGKLKSGPGIAVLLTPLPFYYATCIPSVCTDEDLMVSLTKTFYEIERKVVKLDCHEEGRSNHTKFDGFDAFVCALLGLLALLSVIGTIIEENNLERCGRTPVGKLILNKLTCFSVTKNLRAIFRYKHKERSIPCLHGIRVITLIWVMGCHQVESGFKYMVNYIELYKAQREQWIFQLILNGYQSVETFFLISGILLSYRLFPVIFEGKDLSAKVFLKQFTFSLFRRVVRLLPCIFVVAAFSATLVRFLGFGPRSAALDKYAERCRNYWWKDPLFVDNLIHDDVKIITNSDCLDHCWYTAVEMQLFLIVPFIFLPRIYNKLSGFLWLAFLTLMSQVIPLIVMIVNEFTPIPFPYITIQENYEYYSKYYEVPWCRSAPWFIGIWTGIILVKYQHIVKKITKVQVVIGYVVGLALGVILVFGLKQYSRAGPAVEMPMWLGALYGFFSRPLWAILVSFVVVTCYTKRAPYTNAFLSWWGWQPLSRLSFCMYLVSPVVQIWWSSTLYVPLYDSLFREYFEITGTFFISLLIAFLLSTLVEQPLLRLTENIASARGTWTPRQHSRQKE